MKARATVPVESACKRCGDNHLPTTRCSLCGGHGLVTGGYGEPEDCPDCGNSGMVWPPRCPHCHAFRKWLDYHYD